MYPNWVHPKNIKEDVTDYLEYCNGSYYVLAQLIAEDYTGLKYHTSWNALMPVVHKIEDTLSKAPIFGYNDDGFSSNNFEVKYQAVLDFIEWYNENNN